MIWSCIPHSALMGNADVLEVLARNHAVGADKALELELTRLRGLFTAMAGQVSSWCSLSYSMGER